MLVRSIVPCLTLALAGCVVVDDDVTRSGFGLAPSGLNNVETDAIANSFGSVSLVTGTDTDGAGAFASIITTTAGTPLSSSDITYSGTYEVIGIENIDNVIDLFGPDFIQGNTFSDIGTITLNANVASNTLTGSDGTLAVSGVILGTNLDGTIIYDGQAGQLDGAIFSEGGIAAFHGSDGDRVFAGGLTFAD